MKKVSFLFLVCIISIVCTNAQTLVKYTVSTENVPVRFAAIQLCDLGGVHPRFMIAGTINNDILLMKVRANGDYVSSYRIPYLDGTVRPVITSMIVDADNSVVVAGYRDISTTNDNTNAFIMRFNYSTGTITFLNQYVNTTSLFTRVIEPSSTGPFIVVGQNAPNFGSEDALIMQVDRSTGSLTSVNNINYNSSDTYYSIISNGTTYHTAARFTPFDAAASGHRPVLSKFDASFNNLGRRYYITPSSASPGTDEIARMYGVDLTQIGKYIYMLVDGNDAGTDNSNAAFRHLYMVKALTFGNSLSNVYENRYDFGFDFDGRWHSIKEIDASNLMCLGSHWGSDDDNLEDAFLMKVGINGIPIWTMRYPFEIDNGAAHTDALNISGSFARAVGFIQDDATLKYFGALLTVFTADGINGCETPETPDIVNFDFDELVPEPNYTSTTGGTPVSSSVSTLLYTKITVCNSPRLQNNEIVIELPIDPISINPNPSSGVITLELNEYFETKPQIEVLDCLGRLISTFEFDGKSLTIDLSQNGKGLFFIRMLSVDKIYTKSIVIN